MIERTCGVGWTDDRVFVLIGHPCHKGSPRRHDTVAVGGECAISEWRQIGLIDFEVCFCSDCKDSQHCRDLFAGPSRFSAFESHVSV